jgi:hypothetical protein
MGVRVTFVQSGADNSRKRKQMISRWMTGAALSAAAITLVACGGGSETTTGPGGITILPSGAVSLLAGQSAPLTPANALKIDAGNAGSENVLVLVDTGLTSISATANYTVGVTGVGNAGAVSPPATTLSPAPEGTSAFQTAWTPKLDVAFGMRLNERSRARFRGGFGAARAALASRRASPTAARMSLASAAPQVGDIFDVNVSDDACSNIQTHGARVVAISTQAIVLADTLNPTGGFTATDYQRFAARFDTLVYPLDVNNFGKPADIDNNGKVILLFTRAVNELTPANSGSYVGGFFYGRDLFPTTAQPGFDPCPGSNYAEMFYLLAPDPSGQVNGNVRRTGFVDSVTTSVIAHEFQHLINASRRMYVNDAPEFEEGWLDEGLAHVAEELLFYRESNLAPRSNVTLADLRASAQTRNAFNEDMSSNAGRYRNFLLKPSENSPFRGDDSLETRGATWDLLRYLADRKAGSAAASDAATWQALVGTTRVGIANLSAVFGADLPARVRDWNISHYTDDLVSGAPVEFTQPSWNFHDIYPGLSGTGNTYPLKVDALSSAGATGSLIGGAAAYYRFSIPAGTTANLTLTAPGPVSARVIRVR